MDEESNTNRRLLIAAAICLLVLMVWPVLFPRAPRRPGAPVEPERPTTTETGTVSRGAEAPRTARAPEEATSPAPELFEFAGEVAVDKDKLVPFEVRLTNVGGGVEWFALPTYHERSKDNEVSDRPIGLADPVGRLAGPQAAFQQMAGIRFLEGTTFDAPSPILFEVIDKEANRVRYRHRTREGIEIEREYLLHRDSFEIEMAVTVRNKSEREQKHRLGIGAALRASEAMKKGGGFFSSFVPPPDHLQALCYTAGDVEREDFASVEGDAEVFSEGVRWVAVDRQYFLAAIVLRDRGAAACRLESKDDVARAALALSEATLRPGEETRHKFTAYLGVKKQALLTRVDSELEGAVDYRILGLNLAPLCNALLAILALIQDLTGSWGVAILGLTLLVKLILFPLNQRSGRSMRAMAALKPEMEAIKSKFPEDRQRQSEETLRLYREHNVNPAGGCLPILIQMPIWFALYRSLWVSVDLYQEGFLWIADLTTRDPYWILPVVLVAVMFIQQKMTPTTMDPVQQKMMLYTMPLLFGGLMAALPAGLVFYILVNTLLTIVQQHFINKSIGPIGGPTSAREAPA